MKKIFNYIWFVLATIVLWTACAGEEEPIPSFLQIDAFELTTQAATEGSNSHNIQDVWVYAAGNLIGSFNLPASIPILEEGMTDIIIDPGIRDNGISGSARIYPYYTRFETSVNLVAGESIPIVPTSTYNPNTEFVLVEDFEESNLFTDDNDNDSETKVETTLVGAFEGKSGKIELTTDNPLIQVASSLYYADLPQDGSTQVYLELDYKNEVSLGIGVVGLDNFGFETIFYSHVVNPKGDWNKVYINLTEVLLNSDLERYQIAFAANLVDGLTEATILLDNVKLVHAKQ